MLIVIEGIDASGKATQTQRLLDRAIAEQCSATSLSFPRYGRGLFADAIAAYLNGRFGDLDAIDPHLVALLFAGDRFEHRSDIVEAMNKHALVVLDRYIASNLAYQAARVEPSKRAALTQWIQRLEHDVYGLPRPDLTILLDLPPELAADLLRRKRKRSYTDDEADLHERDRTFMAAVHDVYGQLAADANWAVVACATEAGEVRDADAITADVWSLVAGKLNEIRASSHVT